MKFKKFWLAAAVSAAITAVVFSLNSAPVSVFRESESVSLPVLMYHCVLPDTSRVGKYVITPEQFEADLEYLEKCGYSAVSAKQLIQFVYAGEPLPDKPVLLTFDDGMYNNAEYILPILEKHGACAVFSVVGSYTDEYSASGEVNPAYSYLRWDDIRALADTGRIEFGNHSYGFHSISGARYGTKRKSTENSLEYINAFFQDTQKMQSEFYSNCSFRPVIYTYPFGSYSKESSRVLKKMGFLMSFSCEEGVNRLTHDGECLFFMSRYNRDGRLAAEEFFRRIKL